MLAKHDALLVVDVQRDFLPGGALGVANGDEVVPLLAACVGTFERQQLPIIASRDWHPADHCSFQAQGGPWPPHCIADTAGSQIDPALNLPATVETVDKATSVEKDAYSAFEDTRLDSILRKKGVNRLFIGGLATEYCVLNTARDALTHGYDVVVLQDAIRAIDPSDGENAIRELQNAGATIGQTSELIDG